MPRPFHYPPKTRVVPFNSSLSFRSASRACRVKSRAPRGGTRLEICRALNARQPPNPRGWMVSLALVKSQLGLSLSLCLFPLRAIRRGPFWRAQCRNQSPCFRSREALSASFSMRGWILWREWGSHGQWDGASSKIPVLLMEYYN